MSIHTILLLHFSTIPSLQYVFYVFSSDGHKKFSHKSNIKL